MANMSYCRFTNTLSDLWDCRDALDERKPLSDEEYEAALKLVEMCREIVEDCPEPTRGN